MSRIVSADEARKLLEGASGPFSLWLPEADGDWRIVAHDTPMKRRRVVAKCGYAREEAAMLAAAPDLAHTVVVLTGERDDALLAAAVGEAVVAALRGEEVSDFMQSFGPVMEAQTIGHTARLLQADCDVLWRAIKDACGWLRVTDDDENDWPKLPTYAKQIVEERDRLLTILNCETGKSAPGNWTRNDVDPKREGIAWYRRWEADGSEPGEEDTDQTRVAWVRHDSEADMTTWCWEIEAPTLGAFGKRIAHGENYETAYEAIEACDKCAEVEADDAKVKNPLRGGA